MVYGVLETSMVDISDYGSGFGGIIFSRSIYKGSKLLGLA